MNNSYKRINNKKVSELFKIPYPTICDWNKKESRNWRKGLLVFLSSLSEKEIDLIKNRSKQIE